MLLVLLSAGLYAALGPSHLGWLLAWLALAPFLLACVSSTPGAAAALGLLFGATATMGVAWWFPGMLENYFGVTPLPAWLGLVAAGVCLDGPAYALLGAWLAFAARRRL